MIVELRAEARAQAATRRAWWVANRPAAASLFDEELESAIHDLAERPASIPFLLTRDDLPIRRWLPVADDRRAEGAVDHGLELAALDAERVGLPLLHDLDLDRRARGDACELLRQLLGVEVPQSLDWDGLTAPLRAWRPRSVERRPSWRASDTRGWMR